MTTLSAGQSLMLNNRLWSLRQVRPLKGRNLELEAIGASDASQGMTRVLRAVQYGDDLFVAQRRGGYWRANLHTDWTDSNFGPLLQCQSATSLDLLDAHTRHPAAGKLKNSFSWSYSRAAKYQGCPRAYFYHYYAAWEGWQQNAPLPVRKVYLLKNLTDTPRWRGTLVHETLKFAMARLKAGHPVDEAGLLDQLHRRARVDIADSQNGRYRQSPNKLTGFQEHYYKTGQPQTDWQAAQSTAKRLLHTFVNSDLYANLRSQPAKTFLNVETLQSFTVAGVKVWVQMDLARYDGGAIYLYDWKTGTVDPAEMQRQLGIYGLYVRYAWPELASVPVKGVVYALADDRLHRFNLDDTLLQATQKYVEASTTQLQNLLVDPQTNLAEIRRFPMIDDLSVCRNCQFRELCGRA